MSLCILRPFLFQGDLGIFHMYLLSGSFYVHEKNAILIVNSYIHLKLTPKLLLNCSIKHILKEF